MKKTKAPHKRPKTKKKAKARSKTSVPTLVITIDANCQPQNNQNLHPPHASKSDGGGFPHHVKFKADVRASVCTPAGYLVPETDGKPFWIGPGSSRGFTINPKAPSNELHFTPSCDPVAPCMALRFLNGDEILIDP